MAVKRLDRLLSELGVATRSELRQIIKSGVWLFRGSGVNSCADTTFLWGLFQSRGLRFDCQGLAAFTNQLIDCRQNGHLLSIRVNL